MTLRDRILSAKPKGKSVEIESVGLVFISQMTGEEFIALQKLREGTEDTTEFAISAIQSCLKDEDGKRVFGDSEAEKTLVKSLPYHVISRIFSEILKINSFTDETVSEAKKN